MDAITDSMNMEPQVSYCSLYVDLVGVQMV